MNYGFSSAFISSEAAALAEHFSCAPKDETFGLSFCNTTQIEFPRTVQIQQQQRTGKQ